MLTWLSKSVNFVSEKWYLYTTIISYFGCEILILNITCLLRAASLDHGLWTAPYFDCHGLVKMWKITYASPFFGWDSLRKRIEFKWVAPIFCILLISFLDSKYSFHTQIFSGELLLFQWTSGCLTLTNALTNIIFQTLSRTLISAMTNHPM